MEKVSFYSAGFFLMGAASTLPINGQPREAGRGHIIIF
jgi:hypothetical protein